MNEKISWEDAVKRLRSLPEEAQLVRDAYLDADNVEAAKRFEASEEFLEVTSILKNNIKKPPPWTILDIGAGNGIAAYAFAKAGHKVFALEPDPSNDVGAGAIKRLKDIYKLDIEILESAAEHTPLMDNTVDIVYIRQALHHAGNLQQCLAEAYRVLKNGGYLLATREHVADNEKQLKEFLASHPLHGWYGGEHAYTLQEYISSIQKSGLTVRNISGLFESAINYAPMSMKDFKTSVAEKFRPFGINRLLNSLFKKNFIWNFCASFFTKISRSPGRLYSFVAVKNETGKL